MCMAPLARGEMFGKTDAYRHVFVLRKISKLFVGAQAFQEASCNFVRRKLILLMEEILHQLIGSLSHYSQG